VTTDPVELVADGVLTVREAQRKYRLPARRIRGLMADGTLPYAVLDDRGTRVIPDRALAEYVANLLEGVQ
jgi:hypothetical protein